MVTERERFRLLRFDRQKSDDTIEALEVLLKHARDGKLRGIIFSAMYEGRHDVGATGKYRHLDATCAIGAAMKLVAALEHNLK